MSSYYAIPPHEPSDFIFSIGSADVDLGKGNFPPCEAYGKRIAALFAQCADGYIFILH